MVTSGLICDNNNNNLVNKIATRVVVDSLMSPVELKAEWIPATDKKGHWLERQTCESVSE